MSLYRRPDSQYWWAVFTKPDGGTLRRSSKTTDKKEAEKWLVKTQHELWQQQRLGVKPKYLWDDTVVKWCEETRHKATHHEDISKARWLHPYLGGKVLADITRSQLMEIAAIKAKESSPSTANRYMALIRAIFRQAAFVWEWIHKAPKIHFHQEPPGWIRFLTQAQFKALLQRLPEHQHYIVLFALATGLRQSNVVGLQ